jgi:hypothetical protein
VSFILSTAISSADLTSLVFQETLTQGKEMLASFTNDADGIASRPGCEPVVEDILHWTMAVTLNVISGAAFSFGCRGQHDL